MQGTDRCIARGKSPFPPAWVPKFGSSIYAVCPRAISTGAGVVQGAKSARGQRGISGQRTEL